MSISFLAVGIVLDQKEKFAYEKHNHPAVET